MNPYNFILINTDKYSVQILVGPQFFVCSGPTYDLAVANAFDRCNNEARSLLREFNQRYIESKSSESESSEWINFFRRTVPLSKNIKTAKDLFGNGLAILKINLKVVSVEICCRYEQYSYDNPAPEYIAYLTGTVIGY